MASQMSSNSTVGVMYRLVQTNTNEIMKASHYWPFVKGNIGCLSQKTSDAEKVPMSTRHPLNLVLSVLTHFRGMQNSSVYICMYHNKSWWHLSNINVIAKSCMPFVETLKNGVLLTPQLSLSLDNNCDSPDNGIDTSAPNCLPSVALP